MSNARRATLFLLIVALFFVGLYVGCKLPRWFGRGGATRTYNTPVMLQQVQTLSDLVTVKYVLERVEVWDDPPAGLVSQFVAGDNRILLLAHGVVKAGVDLGKLKPDDLKIEDKTIWINLPSARITDAYLDDKQTKVIERTTGFLRTFDKDLEQNIRRTAVEDLRLAAGRGGILRDADERARTQLAKFFTLMGFDKVEFRVTTGPIPGWPAEDTRVLPLTN
jgi:Protein of unknown function (DUF4230)